VGALNRSYDGKLRPHSLDRAIAAVAARQYGVVSIARLRALGATDDEIESRIRSGYLIALHRGVYAVGHTAVTHRGRELAAVFACGPEAVLSHRSAAGLWGLLPSPKLIEVTRPRSGHPRAGFVVHRTRRLHEDDRTVVDGIPVTGIARTIVDMSDMLGDRRLAELVHESEVQRLLDLRAIEAAQARVPGRAGRHRLRRVLAAYAEQPRFARREAERLFFELCHDYGLPLPQTGVALAGYEIDFLWSDLGIAVEVDGRAAHGTRRAFQADRTRDRLLAAHGIQVIRVPWEDLTQRPAAFAHQLKAIRAARARLAKNGSNKGGA
jgi:very-short-patch-repair endonuclease